MIVEGAASTVGFQPRNHQHFLGQALERNRAAFELRWPALNELLIGLAGLPNTDHIPLDVVIYASGLSITLDSPFAIIRHKANYSAKDKADILFEQGDEISKQLKDAVPIEPLKTVTLQVRHKEIKAYFLIAGIGDFRIDDRMKKRLLPFLQESFGSRGGFDYKLNTPENSPAKPGLVSPFISDPKYIQCLFYRVPPDDKNFVAIAVSLNDSLIISRSVFSDTLRWWQSTHSQIHFKYLYF